MHVRKEGTSFLNIFMPNQLWGLYQGDVCVCVWGGGGGGGGGVHKHVTV